MYLFFKKNRNITEILVMLAKKESRNIFSVQRPGFNGNVSFLPCFYGESCLWNHTSVRLRG